MEIKESIYDFKAIASNGKEVDFSQFKGKPMLIINTAIPMLFAVGRHRQREDLCDRAFDFLEQLKAEDNHIIRMWKACGLEVKTAGDSQALIQLKKQYCDKRDCLRCRIGYEYLKKLRVKKEDGRGKMEEIK